MLPSSIDFSSTMTSFLFRCLRHLRTSAPLRFLSSAAAIPTFSSVTPQSAHAPIAVFDGVHMHLLQCLMECSCTCLRFRTFVETCRFLLLFALNNESSRFIFTSMTSSTHFDVVVCEYLTSSSPDFYTISHALPLVTSRLSLLELLVRQALHSL